MITARSQKPYTCNFCGVENIYYTCIILAILLFHVWNSLFFYSALEIILRFSCADLAEGRGAVSGLRHGLPQEVRVTLPGVQHLWRREPGDPGDGGGRARVELARGYLEPGDLSDRMRR